MNYDAFLHLQGHAKIVITDSGGIQEETSFLGVPCLTLRDSTERPITVEQGTNILVNPENLLRVSEQTLATPRKPLLPIEAWDGKAAIRATADLINWLENLG
jgi:UDP-N-acetylglucosamine 2-epimerase (non-hydrolysing)